MAISRSYTYLGALKGKPGAYKLALGKYNITDGTDQYLQATKCTLTFTQFKTVQVLSMYGDAIANTALLPSLTSVVGNIVTFSILESGGAGVIFPEKTNAEAYSQTFSFYVLVAGM